MSRQVQGDIKASGPSSTADVADKNQALYEDPDVADEYGSTDYLLAAEVNLFMKYRDRVWDANTLDLGCGGGRTIHYLQRYTAELVGADYSSAMVQRCQQRFPALKFFEADARDLQDLDDGKFDFVLFSWNGIDSVPHHDRLKILESVHRVLKPNGLFIFSSHNATAGLGGPPRLKLTWNPKRAIRRVIDFVQSKRNYRKNRALEYTGDDYSVIVDNVYQYRSIAYCITKESQRKQLGDCGFELLDAVATDGRFLSQGEEDSDSAWNYYACQRASTVRSP